MQSLFSWIKSHANILCILIAMTLLTSQSMVYWQNPNTKGYAGVDFYDYYYASKAIVHNHSIYDHRYADEQTMADQVPMIPGTYYIYPGLLAILLIPLTALPAHTAAILWYIFSATLLLASTYYLFPRRPIWLILTCLFAPAGFSLLVGQINIVILTLLTTAWLKRTTNPTLAGITLGIAIMLKVSPLLLFIPILYQKKWRMFFAAISTMLLATGLTELFAPGSTYQYITEILPSLTAASTDYAHPVNQSIQAFFTRLFAHNPWTVPLYNQIAWVKPSTIVSTIFLLLQTFLWSKRAKAHLGSQDTLLWSSCSIILVIASPMAWESTLVILLLPFALLWDNTVKPLLIFAIILMTIPPLLDGFNLIPEKYPLLQYCSPLVSCGLLGALTLWASINHLKTEPEHSIKKNTDHHYFKQRNIS